MLEQNAPTNAKNDSNEAAVDQFAIAFRNNISRSRCSADQKISLDRHGQSQNNLSPVGRDVRYDVKKLEKHCVLRFSEKVLRACSVAYIIVHTLKEECFQYFIENF